MSAAPEAMEIIIDGQHKLRERLRGLRGIDTYRAESGSLSVQLHFFPGYVEEGDPAYEAFEHMAQSLTRLCHAGICDVLDVGCFRGRAFMVTEHIEGLSIAQGLAEPALPLNGIAISLAVADALRHAQKAGVVHGAIDESCIVVASDGTVKLCGLGFLQLEALLAKRDWSPGAETTRMDFAALDSIISRILQDARKTRNTPALGMRAVSVVQQRPIPRSGSVEQEAEALAQLGALKSAPQAPAKPVLRAVAAVREDATPLPQLEPVPRAQSILQDAMVREALLQHVALPQGAVSRASQVTPPPTAIPQSAMQQSAVQQNGIAHSAFPQTTNAQPVVPQSAMQQSVIPQNANAQSVVPQSAIPQPAISQSAIPQAAMQQSAFAQAAMQQSAFSQAAMQQSAFAQAAMQQSAFAQAAMQQSAFPQAAMPQSAISQSAIPQNVAPQHLVPQSAIPYGANPHAALESAIPYGANPHAALESAIPYGANPYSAVESAIPYGANPDSAVQSAISQPAIAQSAFALPGLPQSGPQHAAFAPADPQPAFTQALPGLQSSPDMPATMAFGAAHGRLPMPPPAPPAVKPVLRSEPLSLLAATQSTQSKQTTQPTQPQPTASKPSKPAAPATAKRRPPPVPVEIEDDDIVDFDYTPQTSGNAFTPPFVTWLRSLLGPRSPRPAAFIPDPTVLGSSALDPPYVQWLRRWFPALGNRRSSEADNRARTINLALTCAFSLVALAIFLHAL